MNTQEIANQLVELCRTGNYDEAHKALYSENAVSIEPKGAAVEMTEGIEGIKEKGKQWGAMVQEVHSSVISDPIVAGNNFAVTMIMDITFKEMGRTKMEEVCVYETANGKITKEQFFYPTQANG
ncbi:MAG TPA: nuclear transport factor 2 family protein [Bacteroidetes bacterium]|nr:nuclear transport factor 2 family protein [Bacteroidota bacterium]